MQRPAATMENAIKRSRATTNHCTVTVFGLPIAVGNRAIIGPADPQERICIAASSADKLARARAIAEKLNQSARELRNHFGELGTDTGEAEPSEEMLRDLRSLGYLR